MLLAKPLASWLCPYLDAEDRFGLLAHQLLDGSHVLLAEIAAAKDPAGAAVAEDADLAEDRERPQHRCVVLHRPLEKPRDQRTARREHAPQADFVQRLQCPCALHFRARGEQPSAF